MRYDGFDRLRCWIFPSPTTAGQVNEGDFENYTYDLVGNRTRLRRRDGTEIVHAYDNLNRVIVKSAEIGSRLRQRRVCRTRAQWAE